MRSRWLVIAALLVASTARAEDFWSAISEDPDDARARKNYEHEMTEGDSFAQLASNHASNDDEMKRQLLLAVKAYDNAELARPDAPEPYYRAGLILRTFFVSCSGFVPLTWCRPGHAPPSVAAKMVVEWSSFKKLAPLDPRVDFDFMFDLAIASTQAAGDGVPDDKAQAHLEDALTFYQEALHRVGLNDDLQRANLVGNLAETYMMLGRMDDAIEQYQLAARNSGDIGTIYGLAVALDRDEQGAKAREIIRALGPDAVRAFTENLGKGQVFFVPSGEVFYYLALVEEAFGDDDQAELDWANFVASGAHPRFAERARANHDALAKRKHGKPAPARPPHVEYEP